MKDSRAFLLFIIASAALWLTIGCQRSLPLQEGAGEKITRTTPMHFPQDGDRIVQRSTELMEDFAPAAGKNILSILFSNASAIALIPAMTETAFIAAGNRGTGLLLTRRNNQWTLPVFVSVSGSSLREQIGATSTDLLLVFRNPDTVSRLGKEGDIGLDAGLTATLGPMGASADLSFIEDADLVAYKRIEGEFLGLHIPGGVLSLNPEMTLAYYAEPEQAVRGYYANEAERLIDDLLSMGERSMVPKMNATALRLTLERLANVARREMESPKEEPGIIGHDEAQVRGPSIR